MSPNSDELNEFWNQFENEFNQHKVKLIIELAKTDLDYDGSDMQIEPQYKKKLSTSLYVKKSGNELF